MTRKPNDNPLPLRASEADRHARLDDLIDQYELALDVGDTITAEALCANDPELLTQLRESVWRLQSLDRKLAAIPQLSVPVQIGEFAVLEPIGSGATGMVFRCRQKNPDRDVAVKLLKPFLDVDGQQHRFNREMAAFSAIKEEGIAAVFQTGIIEWCGVRCLWIAMELLDGGTICDYVAQHSMSEAHILTAFRTVCETLRAAHRLGILHRDIKPSNILMSSDGMPHLVDFGVAKLPGSVVGVQQTEPGTFSIQGTAAWMAPELLLSEHPIQSDVRCEIFSLGVVLFEMLSGRHPIVDERLTAPQIAARMAQGKLASLAVLRPTASPDLVAFTSKLLAFDASQRYQNLDEVLTDLQLLLCGEPVRARFVSVREQTFRWCRHHWMGAVTSLIALVALVTVFTTVLITSGRLKQQAQLLSQQTSRLESQSVDLQHSLKLRDRSISNGTLRSLQGSLSRVPAVVHRALSDPVQFPEEVRGMAWRFLNFQSDVMIRSLPNTGGSVSRLLFDSKMRYLFCVSEPGRLSIFDLASGLKADSPVLVSAPAKFFQRPQGHSIIAVTSDRRMAELSIPDGRLVREFPQSDGMQNRYTVAPDGKRGAGILNGQFLFVLDFETGLLRQLSTPLQVRPIALWFSNDSLILHCVDVQNVWRSWWADSLGERDSENLAQHFPLIAHPATATLSTSMAAGSELALAQSNGVIHIHHVDDHKVPRKSRIQLHDERLRQIEFLPPFHVLTTGNSVWIHHLFQDELPRVLPVAEGSARAAAASADGRFIAVGGNDGSVSIVDLKTPTLEEKSLAIFRGETDLGFGFSKSLRVLAEYPQILVGHTGGWVANVSSATGERLEAFALCEGPVVTIDRQPNGRWIAFGNGGKAPSITLMELSTTGRLCAETSETYSSLPKSTVRIQLDADARVVRFSDDGKLLIAGLRNGEVLVVDCADWSVRSRWKRHDLGVFALDVKGDLCVTGGTDKTIRLTRISDGIELRSWQAHSQRVSSVVLNRDGSRVYSASVDGEIGIWTVQGQRLRSQVSHLGPVTCLDLSSDGTTLVSGGEDHRILLWDATTGDLQFEITDHEDLISDLRFTADGEGLVSSSFDGSVRIWGTTERQLPAAPP